MNLKEMGWTERSENHGGLGSLEVVGMSNQSDWCPVLHQMDESQSENTLVVIHVKSHRKKRVSNIFEWW